jgi:hypothetical protein
MAQNENSMQKSSKLEVLINYNIWKLYVSNLLQEI